MLPGTGLVYYETELFVTQAAQAVKAILDMQLGDDQGRVHVKFVDWVKLQGPAKMNVVPNNWQETYAQSYSLYDSQSHCVVLVESPPVFGANVLGVANECFYCDSANVAFVTNNNEDSLTFVTIAHELGKCVDVTRTSSRCNIYPDPLYHRPLVVRQPHGGWDYECADRGCPKLRSVFRRFGKRNRSGSARKRLRRGNVHGRIQRHFRRAPHRIHVRFRRLLLQAHAFAR